MIILNNVSIGNIKDLSFYVSSGELLCINDQDQEKINHLFKVMSGERKPEQGVIKYLDKGVYKRDIDRKSLGFVFKENILLKDRTLFENLEYIMQIKDIDMFSYKSRIRRILEIVDLKESYNKKPEQLLKHQLKRVNIAQAILNYPPALILEDPTKGLDELNSLGIIRLLKRLNRFSMTVVLLSTDNNLLIGKDIRRLKINNSLNNKKKGSYA
ncbi:ATP-binding cassette domain-containing protein [Natronospora cellulosivora (SeqCode)]